MVEFVLQHGEGAPRCDVACFSHTVTPKGNVSVCLGRKKGIPSVFDGAEHMITIRYTIKPEVLDVVFEDVTEVPVLSVPANLRKTNLQLEGGRAWLGLITATSDDPRQHACSPCIMSWKFSGGGAAESKSVDGWRNLRLEYQVRTRRIFFVCTRTVHYTPQVLMDLSTLGGPPIRPGAAPGRL